MDIGVIGANGKAGNLIMKEAVSRGHQVTAIVRDASKVKDKSVSVIEKDIFNLESADLKQFDTVINAFGAPLGEEQAHVDAGNALIDVLKGTDTRIIVVGGAGSLFADEGKMVQIMDLPDFPDLFKPTAKGQARNLQELRATNDLTWTFISPPAVFDAEGKRIGTYKTGKDILLLNSDGESYISYADFAIAVVDEIENLKFKNERFTVVGEKE